ncbi:TetR family transcriptional regulator [Salmonella enterica subsp. enterica serovar Choleraesuis]|nr:TetR family transcriptional regulator [Salmonella enterica subsp. enterica serovar Choleraesuis]
MTSATQHRKKDPVRIKEQLLEAAVGIAGVDGIAAISLNAVAQAAGVSKGGLLHHFPSRQALIYAVYQRLLAIMEAKISALIAADSEHYGCFSRAYLRYITDMAGSQEGRQLAVLSMAMPEETVLRQCWRNWMLEHLEAGDEFDNSPSGTLVRYAADGIWLSELTEGETLSAEHRRQLLLELEAMTWPGGRTPQV